MKKTKIQKIPIHHIPKLHNLFKSAIQKDFNYFSNKYQAKVRKSNNLVRMYMGALNPNRVYIGLYCDYELVGYSLSSIQHDRQAFLYWLFVDPNLRHQKLGIRLLGITESNLQSRGVDSISLVTHNQHHFYERQNYQIERILPKLVSDVDMYVMKKQLA